MKFGEAIEAIEEGKKLARPIWASNSAQIYLLKEDGDTVVIAWSSKDHPPETYRPTTGDMRANDWEVVG